MQLTDQFNRVHTYLRISLTHHCNLRCFYCMPDDDEHPFYSEAMMNADEIDVFASTFCKLGINKIRLTGGEPLVRKDVGDIIRRLSKYPVELTLSTNGVRLHEFADVLKDAGVRSVNISLDTLQADKFLLVTRRNLFDKVWNNIQLMLQKGFNTKINVVIMKGVNDDEITDFIEWTKDTPVQVRFIEFMPFAGNHWQSDKVFSLKEVLNVIAARYAFTGLPGNIHDTAKHYKVEGYTGTFDVISTMSAPFCNTCNRLRLTADGKMKNCLFSQNEVDLLTSLRKGEDIVPLIQQNVWQKKAATGGQFTANFEELNASFIHNRSMIDIGG